MDEVISLGLLDFFPYVKLLDVLINYWIQCFIQLDSEKLLSCYSLKEFLGGRVEGEEETKCNMED